MVLPDTTSVTNEYFLTGELKKTSGSRTYPVAYAYDAQGRMTNLTTWQDAGSGSGSAVTTWNYDSQRGWLTNKRYADGFGPNYTNSPAGRLIGRRWARSVGGNPLSTTYTNNGAGEVVGVTYNDSVTANVGHVFDRLGRLIQINQGTNVTYCTYNLAGQLLSESQNGLVISNRFDAFLRRTNLSLLNGASTLTRTHYGFDDAGRLAYVADGTNVAAYSYLANSPLIQNVRFTNSGTLRFTTQKDYDHANRLTNIASWNSSFTNSFAYTYNTANQRTRVVLADGSYWVYEYDRLGQVTGGRKYWRDGSAVAGQQFGYTYDDIGNRKTAASGGDDLGLALRTSTYTANNLNQYSSRTVPGYLDILGAATNTATVLVNNRPTSRKDDYFRAEFPVDNSQGAVWQGITNVAYLAQTTNVVATNQGNLFLPRTPETFTHDADGNLTNDGRWVYTWDAENRLTQVESLSTGPTASKRRVTYTYDWYGRRVRRQEHDGSSGSYVLTNDLRMAYDGWQCLGDLTTNLVLQRAYVWGLDVSGSQTGAGGVGGLLWYRSASNGTHYASYDGNGNVTALTDAVTGTRSGTYEYGPFGQTLRQEGIAAAENAWRFSTKRVDPVTELVLYEYRVYNATIGRWQGKDPAGESGGCNQYSFVDNRGINTFDILGLFKPRYHEDVTLNALASSGLSAKCIKRIVSANKSQDSGWLGNRKPFGDPLNHFDDNRIVESANRMRFLLGFASINSCKNCGMVNTLLEVFGRVLHALQDFYAHSNYVEVYGLQATATGQITPWDFFEQSRGESFRPPPDVFTGTFWYPLDDAPEPSHDRWNKDEPNSEAGSAVNAVGIRYFDLARDVAIRASNEAWQWLDRRLTPAAKANIGECCK